MDDHDVIAHIDQLVDEEHQLEQQAVAHSGLADGEQERLRQVGIQLDQCWDLLRQRRARRDAGADPETATVRSEATVERYLQ